MAHILNGRELAAELRREDKKTVDVFRKGRARAPKLAVILVGEDPASVLYVNLKEKAAAEVGIAFEKIGFPEDTSEKEVLAAIDALNRRDDVDAMIIQLPLPRSMDTDRVIRAMDPRKDADGFHPDNLKRITADLNTPLPGLTMGILWFIDISGQETRGEEAIIISKSEVFSAPLKVALEVRGMRVGRVYDLSDLGYLSELTRRAKVIVTAMGTPGMITGDMVSDGAVIVDVGTSRGADGKVHGDVLAEDFEGRDVWLTPVPGGVGPVTVAMLLGRTIELAMGSDR